MWANGVGHGVSDIQVFNQHTPNRTSRATYAMLAVRVSIFRNSSSRSCLVSIALRTPLKSDFLDACAEA